MYKSTRSKAEAQFAAIQKRNKQVQVEKNKAQKDRKAHMLKLKALRVAKETAEKGPAG